VRADGPLAGLRYVEQNVDARADFAAFLAAAGPDRLAAREAEARELTPR